MKIDIPHPDEIDSAGYQVTIHSWDTWSMDHTLSYIIVPMLKQLQETKHGAPNTDDEDVPEKLRSTSAPKKENEWDTDDNHFRRWDWIINEMIWAFEYKLNNFDTIMDKDRESAQARMSNGFRLFGKYYESLWD